MGNDFAICVAPTLLETQKDGENSVSNTVETKICEEIHEKPLELPRKTAKSKKSKKKSSIKKCKSKKMRHSRRKRKNIVSVEAELDATEIELKQQKYAIQLLKEQNEYLRKQNEAFIANYGSHFTSTPSPPKPNHIHSPEKLTTETSIHSNNSFPTHSQHSFTSTPEKLTPRLSVSSQLNPDPITEDISLSPISPLEALTGKEASIILSYSNTNNNNGENISFPDTPRAITGKGFGLGSKDKNLCVSNLNECKSFQRIICTLKWYSLCCNNGDFDVLLNKIIDSKYDIDLLNDYQHILHHHEYKLIKNEIDKQIDHKCDISKCNGYKRYNALSIENMSQSRDKQFSLDFMDLIHCYFIHLNDLQ